MINSSSIARPHDPKLLFKFKHLYTVSDGSDKKYDERKYEDMRT